MKSFQHHPKQATLYTQTYMVRQQDGSAQNIKQLLNTFDMKYVFGLP